MPARFVEVTSEVKGELVLADGRFLTMYKPKVAHLLISNDASLSNSENMLRLLELILLIDGKQASIEELLKLDLREFARVMALYNK